MASTSTIAEDAVQETFLRAWKYLDSFRGRGSFEGWLIRICRRCVIDLEATEAWSMPLADAELAAIEEPDYRADTLSVAAGLPIEQREVLVLVGVLGYDYESAAEVLDVPIGTVRSRLHRARSALSEALDAESRSVA
jgi:RNA polymerase sigma-70 factor, ECF subfamily